MMTIFETDVKPALRLAAQELIPKCHNRTARRAQVRIVQRSLEGFLQWYQRHFDLVSALETVRDGREANRIQIPLPAILLAVLCMFWLGLGSLRALDDRLKVSPGLRHILGMVGWKGTISDDTFADALENLELGDLRQILQQQGKRELSRWGAGRYLESEIGQRLKATGGGWMGAKAIIAIDGHELFSSHHRSCDQCQKRKHKVLKHGKKVEIEQSYHKVVVAQWVGVHPAVMMDVESVRPGEGELTAAYRLVERLSRIYGDSIGVIVADALYDNEPFRRRTRKAGYYTVIRHKDARRDPGKTGEKQLDRRDPQRENPDRKYIEGKQRRYECWSEEIPEGAQQYIEIRRTIGSQSQVGALLTDLPAERTPLVAAAMIYETRWWIENTGFHELAGAWSLDRAFVHAGRSTAAQAIVLLGMMAFNAFQVYVYRHLGLNPRKPERTIGDFRRDFLETLSLPRAQAHARAP